MYIKHISMDLVCSYPLIESLRFLLMYRYLVPLPGPLTVATHAPLRRLALSLPCVAVWVPLYPHVGVLSLHVREPLRGVHLCSVWEPWVLIRYPR